VARIRQKKKAPKPPNPWDERVEGSVDAGGKSSADEEKEKERSDRGDQVARVAFTGLCMRSKNKQGVWTVNQEVWGGFPK